MTNREIATAVACALLLAGCGRFGFGPPGNDARLADAPITDHGAVADAPTTRQCIPFSGNWQLETPQLDSVLSSSDGEQEVTLSPDGLTIFFTSTRVSAGGWDSYSAARSTLSAPFGNPQAQAGINTNANELRFLLAPDGLTAYLNAEWDPAGQDPDIWVATRTSKSEAFTKAMFSELAGINTASNEYDPWLSADGLRLYFAQGQYDALNLMLAQRSSVTDAFSPATKLANVNGPTVDDNPTLTSDELVIVFASTRSGVKDLYYATRTSRSQPFGPPKQLPGINTPNAEDTEPWIHTPTCELFFSSGRQGGVGYMDIYRTRFASSE